MPSQELLVIRRNHEPGQVSLDPLRWGLVPHWCSDPKGGRKPINAKRETVRDLPTFGQAYRRRRCIVPVDGFFEWRAVKGEKTKQPYAIAMKDGAPFGLTRRGSARNRDPRDPMRPYPAELMRIWPISTRVNQPQNDEPSILEPIELAASV